MRDRDEWPAENRLKHLCDDEKEQLLNEDRPPPYYPVIGGPEEGLVSYVGRPGDAGDDSDELQAWRAVQARYDARKERDQRTVRRHARRMQVQEGLGCALVGFVVAFCLWALATQAGPAMDVWLGR